MMCTVPLVVHVLYMPYMYVDLYMYMYLLYCTCRQQVYMYIIDCLFLSL